MWTQELLAIFFKWLSELTSYSAVNFHQATTWLWALWNDVIVKGGISMEAPTNVNEIS